MTTIVEQLAGLSAQIRYETLPPAVGRKAKMMILDTLGCVLGGFTSDSAKAMRRVIRQLGGYPEATILGTAERTAVLGATWANGTSIRYLDDHDTLMSRDPSHPSGHLASVLAIAEAQAEKTFCDQARPCLTAEHVQQVIDAIWSLERLEHAGDLVRLLVM
jgi:2-methylcitrate dehydratase